MKRGLAIALAIALVVVALPRPASASHGDAGVSFEPWLSDCGGDRPWMGFEGGYGLVAYRICFYVDAWMPYIPDKLGLIQTPPDVQRVECPEGFHGFIGQYQDSQAGLCIQVSHTVPDDDLGYVGLDISGCEVPDGREGEDPAVIVGDGGVAVCLLPVVDIGGRPNADVSLEPCEPETVDPEVHVAGGGVQICVDSSVAGVGADLVNPFLQQVNETANEV